MNYIYLYVKYNKLIKNDKDKYVSHKDKYISYIKKSTPYFKSN